MNGIYVTSESRKTIYTRPVEGFTKVFEHVIYVDAKWSTHHELGSPRNRLSMPSIWV